MRVDPGPMVREVIARVDSPQRDTASDDNDPAEPQLKVCMLAACPFPANHGTPGSIREMSEAICERGHEVHIVTYHFGEDIPLTGPMLHRIPPLTGETAVVVGPTTRRPLYDLQMVFKTLQVIRDHHPDLIHAHGYEAALVAWLARLATGIPVVYSGHNTMEDELASYDFIKPRFLADALARFLDAFVPRTANRCLPHSANIEKFFHAMGLRGKTEPIINFGIDVNWVMQGDGAAVRQRYGLDDIPVVLYTGVLDQFQRLDLLLDAMVHVGENDPQAKLLVVVTIPHEKHQNNLRAEAAKRGLTDRLVMTDPQPLARVRDFLMAADVAVVPRPQACGFPIKLLNYMAARRACVLFASSASTGLVDGDNALLVAPDTGQALGDGILDVLRDADLRDRLARNGQRFVRRRHDRSVVARQICATYFRTLHLAGRSPSLSRRRLVHPGFTHRILEVPAGSFRRRPAAEVPA